jgi:argininosuccinate lyase
MKLWQKDNGVPTSELSKEVEHFTIGNDHMFDMLLAPYDVLGSIAHTKMLAETGLLTREEADGLLKELKAVHTSIAQSKFRIDDQVEDIHSPIELILTEKLGNAGKKIHNARSRNDQVLLDIKLFLRNEIEELVNSIHSFFELLQSQSEKYKDNLLPGYTHLQLAMPSSFGLWFGAYAESLVDDMITLRSTYDIVNKNPLGSAAGFGTSFPINRQMTTKLLGFAELSYNSVYAQMGRGKTERVVAQSLANVADTLSRLSMDACLYLSQNFGFISFPQELTTGSSIMPHKKNPDVFELIRAHCNRIKALPNEIMLMTTNLPSGYHRDMQLLKEHVFPAFTTLKQCMEMASLMIAHIEVKDKILDDEKYKYIFSVEEVNKLVLQGMPFRDAYKKIGIDIGLSNFVHDGKIKHTHEGSIGNLSNSEIKMQMDKIIRSFPFEQVKRALADLSSL